MDHIRMACVLFPDYSIIVTGKEFRNQPVFNYLCNTRIGLLHSTTDFDFQHFDKV